MSLRNPTTFQVQGQDDRWSLPAITINVGNDRHTIERSQWRLERQTFPKNTADL
jgi:hypothetical protein